MSDKKVKKSLNSLKNNLIDDIIKKIEKMDISENEKLKISFNLKNNDKPKRKQPIIPIEKQCSLTCKSGKKCSIAKCYKNSCWAHLTKEKREEYLKIKNSNFLIKKL